MRRTIKNKYKVKSRRRTQELHKRNDSFNNTQLLIKLIKNAFNKSLIDMTNETRKENT